MTVSELFLKLLRLLELAILADVILSWIAPNKDQFPRNITSQIADPLCAPFRKLIGPERLGGFDLSPMAALLVLQWMSRMVGNRL